MSAAPKKPQLVRQVAPASAALDLATRTLELECEGLSALKAALQRQLGQAFGQAVRDAGARQGPRDRDRHRQERPCRPEACGHLRLDRHAGLLRASERGQPRRSRHDRQDDAIVAISWSGESFEIGNIVTYSRRFKVPLVAITSRAEFGARQAGRRGAGAAARQGSLPARPGADHLHHHAAGHRRLPGHRAAREQGLHRAELQGVPPRRLAGRAASSSSRDVMHTGDRLPLVPARTWR